jgi:UDP-N-acetyl-D-glucosamine dehydrogenase
VSASLNRDRKALNGSRVLILGLAYKRNSRDARESPGPVVCQRLQAFGADVYAVDPHLGEESFPSCVRRAELTASEIGRADIVVIVADHDEFDWELIDDKGKRILDTRHRMPARENVEFL